MLRLWDPATGTLARSYALAQERLTHLAFDDSGRYLIAADATGHSYLWDMQNGYKTATHYGRYAYTYALAWRPGTQTWLIANGNEPVMGRGVSGAPWVVYDRPGEALAYDQDGSRLAIALRPEVVTPSVPIRTPQPSEAAPIVVIDAETGNELLRLDDDGMTYLLAFSPDGTTLVSGTAYTLRFWDATTGALRAEVATAGLPSDWAFLAPDKLAVLSYRGGLAVLDVPSGAVTREIEIDTSAFAGLAEMNGALVTTGGGRPVTVDTATGALGYPFDAPRTVATVTNPVRPWIATASERTVFVRDLTTQATVYELNELPYVPTGLAFSADGSRLAAIEATGYVTVWEMDRGQLVWRSQVVADGLVAVNFAADGRLVLSTRATPRLLVIDGETGRIDEARPLPATAWTLGVGAAGKVATANDNGDVDVYNLAKLTADSIALGDPADRIAALAVNLAGDRLAISWRSGTVELWNIAVGELIATPDVPGASAPDALAFSVNGTLLATGGTSTAPVMLWDAATGDAVRTVTPAGTLFGTLALGFSPDGTLLVVTDGNGATHLLSLTPREPADDSISSLLAQAASLVPRAVAEFTPQERKTYGLDAYVGAYPLSASGSVNIRGEPFVQSLVVRPGDAGQLEALTDEGFLLTSTDRGETWAILARLPLTLTATSLAIPARTDDPMLIATQQGLFRFDTSDGSLHLVHDQPLAAVSYAQTDPDELWAVTGSDVLKSEDGGRSWGKARNELAVNRLYGPLLMAAPNNNPQLVMGSGATTPTVGVWRGAGNGFWTSLSGLPALPLGLATEPGLAWDGDHHTLYLGGGEGQLYATTNVDAPDATQAAATLVADFGLLGRPAPLAVGAGPTLYLTLWGPYGPRLVRGTWDGQTWSWLALRLPVVAAG